MPNWRNEVSIKKYFSNDDSDESVLRIVNVLVPQLERIINKELKAIDNKKISVEKQENLEHYLNQLEDVLSEFKWIQEDINSDTNVSDYGFDSWVEAFNEYLGALYDIGDEIVEYGDKRIDDEKFIWIK